MLEHLNRSLQSCQVIFQREGHDVETLYWAGSTAEVQELAREIAFRGGADAFRIIEFTCSGAGATPGGESEPLKSQRRAGPAAIWRVSRRMEDRHNVYKPAWTWRRHSTDLAHYGFEHSTKALIYIAKPKSGLWSRFLILFHSPERLIEHISVKI